MRTKLLFVAFIAATALSSCKEKEVCYECEKYQYCYEGLVDCGDGATLTIGPICADSEAEREAAKAETAAFYPAVCTVTLFNDTENLVPGNQQEICDSKSAADDAASDLEIAGYKCVKE